MKRSLLLSFLMIGFAGSLFAQGVGVVDETNWALLIITILIAVAEVVFRAVPDKKFTGPIGLLINLLKVASDYLNNKSELQKK